MRVHYITSRNQLYYLGLLYWTGVITSFILAVTIVWSDIEIRGGNSTSIIIHGNKIKIKTQTPQQSGLLSSFADDPGYDEAFYWTCCLESGEAEGCDFSRHQPLTKRVKR